SDGIRNLNHIARAGACLDMHRFEFGAADEQLRDTLPANTSYREATVGICCDARNDRPQLWTINASWSEAAERIEIGVVFLGRLLEFIQTLLLAGADAIDVDAGTRHRLPFEIDNLTTYGNIVLDQPKDRLRVLVLCVEVLSIILLRMFPDAPGG